jgi:GH25 family lysozyme M1 (1,4-beta-N-acetylmuramidase)
VWQAILWFYWFGLVVAAAPTSPPAGAVHWMSADFERDGHTRMNAAERTRVGRKAKEVLDIACPSAGCVGGWTYGDALYAWDTSSGRLYRYRFEPHGPNTQIPFTHPGVGAAWCTDDLTMPQPAIDVGPVQSAAWTVEGVDIGYSAPDWQTIASSGRRFAFLKASEGLPGLYKQAPAGQLAKNLGGTKRAGMVRGVFHYFRAHLDALAQAEHCWDVTTAAAKASGTSVGDWGLALDVEAPTKGDGETIPVGDTYGSEILAWCQRMHALSGMRPLLYTGPGWWNGQGMSDALKGEIGSASHLWLAHWNTPPDCTAHALPNDAAGMGWKAPPWFWQYAGAGDCSIKVPGIGGADVDRFRLDDRALAAFAAAHGAGVSGSSSSPLLLLAALAAGVLLWR